MAHSDHYIPTRVRTDTGGTMSTTWLVITWTLAVAATIGLIWLLGWITRKGSHRK